jgi:hypothetical protein
VREDNQMLEIKKHSQSQLFPSEVVTLAYSIVFLNKFGLVVDIDSDTANVYDSCFHPLIKKIRPTNDCLDRQRLSRQRRKPGEYEGLPARQLECAKRGRNFQFDGDKDLCAKRMACRVWKYLKARRSYLTAAFNILAT